MRVRQFLLASVVIPLGVALAAPHAAAQGELSATDRAAAAQAYDLASAAYMAGQYERAATLFETAYRVSPNATALLQAARAHERAAHPARAATLAARLIRRFEGSAESPEAAQILEGLRPGLLRVELSAEAPHEWELDGDLQDAEDTVAFVPPGEHVAAISFETGVVEERASGEAGASVRLEPVAPRAPEVEPEVMPAQRTQSPALTDAAEDGGLSPWLFATFAAATAVAGGFLIGFGVDAWSGLDAYNASPTRAGLEEGQERELRTNVMIGVTGGLALGTLIVALLTDWGGDSPVTASASLDGFSLGLRGDLQ